MKALRIVITQEKRLALVTAIVELAKDEEGSFCDLFANIRELCDSYYQEDPEPVTREELAMAMELCDSS